MERACMVFPPLFLVFFCPPLLRKEKKYGWVPMLPPIFSLSFTNVYMYVHDAWRKFGDFVRVTSLLMGFC